MSDQPQRSAAEKAQIVTQISALEQQVVQRDTRIRNLEQQLSTVKGRKREPLESQLSAAHEERTALIQEANTLRAEIGMPMVIPSSSSQLPAPQRVVEPAPAKKRGWLFKAAMGLLALVVLCGVINALTGNDNNTGTAAQPTSASLAVEQTAPTEAAASEVTAPTEAIAPTVAPTEAILPTEAPAPTDIPPTEAPAALPVPEAQAAFIQLVESFYQPYRDAENELKASAQRAQRKTALEALLPDRTVTGWTGELASLDTNSEGKAIIMIKPDGSDSITIGTWNNALSDIMVNSLIESGSELFNKLAEMSPGDRVTFSGTFADNDRDHLLESSITENGSMTSPGFIMVFSDVTKQ